MDSITEYDIVDGDSKEKLLAQLFDIGRVNNRPTFQVEVIPRDGDVLDAHKASLLINSLTAEDGSGNCWIISGNISNIRFDRRTSRFEGFFSTKNRRGWLKIIVS